MCKVSRLLSYSVLHRPRSSASKPPKLRLPSALSFYTPSAIIIIPPPTRPYNRNVGRDVQRDLNQTSGSARPGQGQDLRGRGSDSGGEIRGGAALFLGGFTTGGVLVGMRGVVFGCGGMVVFGCRWGS